MKTTNDDKGVQVFDGSGYGKELRPVVMVVEDIDDDLGERVDHFTELGCVALGFKHSDDALDALFVVPSVDLILTDIDLDGTGHDESGIALARFVHETKLDIPVFGYSAYFADQGLREEDQAFFSGNLLPKAMKAEEINETFQMLRQHAVDQRLKRKSQVELLLSTLRKKYRMNIRDVTLVRDLILSTDGANNFDEALCEACYSLSILHPRDDRLFSRPILVWLRENNSIFEAEVYGFSSLYGHGSSEEEAIQNLVELMQLVTQDLLHDADPTGYDANAFRLRRYLLDLFGGEAEH